jgi:SET domain-containing protein
MLQVKTYLDKSPIHGIGVFAAENIKSGQLVWKLNLAIDKIINPNIVFESFELKFLKIYAYFDLQLDKWILPVDNDRFMNHSDNPNSGPLENGDDIAIKDINIGEEITVNYYDTDGFANEKLFDTKKNC